MSRPYVYVMVLLHMLVTCACCLALSGKLLDPAPAAGGGGQGFDIGSIDPGAATIGH